MKYLVYFSTLSVHTCVAFMWLMKFGIIGVVIMIAHWFVFNGCFISHIERYIHLALVGESWLPDNWSTCLFKKWIS